MLKNQRGIAPIILIIILTIVIVGVGAVYQSRKEIKVRSDKTSEVTELKGMPTPGPKKEDINLADSGRLAEKPVEFKADSSESSPKFSITPPAGWEKKASEGNIAAEFLSPLRDKVEEGLAWIDLPPGITVRVIKAEFQSLEEAVESSVRTSSAGVTITGKQKIKVNGEDAYAVDFTMDIRDTAQSIMESQIQEEIANAKKAGKDVSQKEAREDMGKVLLKAKTKALSYVFYKNGYHVTVTGRALESFWDKRGLQIKQSLDTFKFLP